MVSLWGPGDNVPQALTFNGSPYAPFSKGDKLGKVADWAADPVKEAKDYKRAQGRGFRDPYHAYGASASSFFTADEPDASWSFSVVDSSIKSGSGSSSFLGSKGAAGSGNGAAGKTVLRARGGGRPGPSNVGGNRAGAGFGTPAPHGQSAAPPPVSRGPQLPRGARTMTIGSATQHNRRGGGRMQSWQNDKLKQRKPSVPIGADWELLQTNIFSDLQKLNFALPTEKVLGRYGYVEMFNKKMDKLIKAEKLKSVEVTEYNVTTSEDPVINKLAAAAGPPASPQKPHVYATDGIIALLMCATKSNNPWDIIVTKKDGKIFFDKRDNSAIDLPSVDENSLNPPADVADNKIDSAPALALEASYINLNFAANVIERSEDKRVNFENPHPFSAGDEPASAPLLPKGYVYKSFNLEADPESEPQPLVIRIELDTAFEKNGNLSLAKVHALNEYGGAKPLEWKRRFSTQRGAIVAAEMKKNLNKLSQWTTRSLLGSADALKIGFVSRVNAKDNQNHEIIAVLTQNPTLFAKQLGINMANGWGIIKSLVNIFAELDDGKFVVMRDPNAQSVMIYKVPVDTTFEEAA